MMRYIRAFWKALILTLRGEKSSVPYLNLRQWAEQSGEQVRAVYRAADTAKVDPASVKLMIERREYSMKVILDAVEYHALKEYPYLINHVTTNHVTAVYTTNLNDQFLVKRLYESLAESSVKQAVGVLKAHLEAIPTQQPEQK